MQVKGASCMRRSMRSKGWSGDGGEMLPGIQILLHRAVLLTPTRGYFKRCLGGQSGILGCVELSFTRCQG
jgi:hypothetical protein